MTSTQNTLAHPAEPNTPDQAHSAPPGSTRTTWILTVVGVGLVGVVLPILIARHFHALGVPRGDDWSYLRALFRWTERGELDFNNWVSMTLLGQLVLGAPIALLRSRDIAALDVLTALLGYAGLLAIVVAGRRLGIRHRAAVFLAIVVAASPLWLILAVTFMTDVPSVAVSMVSIALGVAAFARPTQSFRLTMGSLAVGFAACTIRQYAVVPVIALGLVTALELRDRGPSVSRRYAIAGVVTMVGAIAFYLVWRSIPNAKPFSPSLPTSGSLQRSFYKLSGLVRLLGLLLLPVTLWVGPIRIVRRAWSAAPTLLMFTTTTAGAWLLFAGLHTPRLAFTGNYVVPNGALARGVAVGARPDIIGPKFFYVLMFAGIAGALVLVAAALPALLRTFDAGRSEARWRDWPVTNPPRAFLAWCATGYGLSYAAASMTGIPVYDRYVLPIVPVVGLLVLGIEAREFAPDAAPRQRGTWPVPRSGLAGTVAACLLVLGVVFAADSASFDGSRWAVASRAARAGWGAPRVGGNFEWVNFYSPTPGTGARKRHQACVIVMIGRTPQPGREVIAVGTYQPPFRDALDVIAVRTARPCSPFTRGAET